MAKPGNGSRVRKVPLVGLAPAGAEEHQAQVAVGVFPGKAHIAHGYHGIGGLAPRIAVLAVRCDGVGVVDLAYRSDLVGHKEILVGAARGDVFAPHPLPNVMSRRAAYYCLDDTRQPMCSGMNITR